MEQKVTEVAKSAPKETISRFRLPITFRVTMNLRLQQKSQQILQTLGMKCHLHLS